MGGNLSLDKLPCSSDFLQEGSSNEAVENNIHPKARHEEQAKKKRLLTCAILKELEKDLTHCLKKLKTFNKLEGLKELKQLILSAWDPSTPGHGRELAEALLEKLALAGGLRDLLTFISSNDEELQVNATRVLELSLTVKNRERVAQTGLTSIVNLCNIEDNEDLKDCGIGLIEHMFKVSENVCSQVITLGGLEAVLYSCRSSNPKVSFTSLHGAKSSGSQIRKCTGLHGTFIVRNNKAQHIVVHCSVIVTL